MDAVKMDAVNSLHAGLTPVSLLLLFLAFVALVSQEVKNALHGYPLTHQTPSIPYST